MTNALKGEYRWSSGIDFEQRRWHANGQRIFPRANEERKDNSENENRVCWSKICLGSLWHANSKAAALHDVQQRAVLSNSRFHVSWAHPATLLVITRRKHLSRYEKPGSGKKASVTIQPGPSWWKTHARRGRAFVFTISAFFSCLLWMESVLPNCTFTSAAQKWTRISNFCWLTSTHTHIIFFLFFLITAPTDPCCN